MQGLLQPEEGVQGLLLPSPVQRRARVTGSLTPQYSLCPSALYNYIILIREETYHLNKLSLQRGNYWTQSGDGTSKVTQSHL